MRETAVDAETIEAVWKKAREIPGLPGSIWRRDRFGMTIRRFDYGRTDCDFGWVVDRLLIAMEGSADHTRLQPLQWRNSADQAAPEPTGQSDYEGSLSGNLKSWPGTSE